MAVDMWEFLSFSQVVSASIALLENNFSPEKQHRGATLLRYVAATPNDVPFVLKKCLFRDMKSISFTAVDSGKPIHVSKVHNHPGVYLWNPARRETVIARVFRRSQGEGWNFVSGPSN